MNQLTKQLSFGCISVFSVLGNALVILFFLHQRSRLKKPYNIMILSLALADFLAGLFVFFSPGYVFATPLYEPTSALALQFYCRVVRIPVFFYLFGYASIYICVLLAIDRWIAVTKPTKYKQAITGTKMILGIVFAYAIAASIVYSGSPAIRIAPQNLAGRRCIIVPRLSDGPVSKAKVIVGFILKSLLPFVLIVVLYTHVVYTLKTKPTVSSQESTVIKRVTIMAALATSALIITWLPVEVNFFVNFLGMTTSVTRTSLHRFFSLLAVFNSCVNPLLYGLANREYRKGYWLVLTASCQFFKCIVHQRNERRVGTTRENTTVENGTSE